MRKGRKRSTNRKEERIVYIRAPSISEEIDSLLQKAGVVFPHFLQSDSLPERKNMRKHEDG